MKIEELWQELEDEARSGGSTGWRVRFALPDPRNLLLVAVESPNLKRALLLPQPSNKVPPRREWPRCTGLELFAAQVDGVAHLGVRLLDPGNRDVFAILAADIATRLLTARDDQAGAGILLDRLRRWQRFLTAGAEPLSLSRQRGLYGELSVLRRHLCPAVGANSAIGGWQAAFAAHQDFQFAHCALEVKATTGKQPQEIRITSERQLDDTGTGALFLCVVVLDERVVEPNTAAVGETLPEAVAAIRSGLAGNEAALQEFDDRLLEAGYLEADAPQFEDRRYAVRSDYCYRVRPGFPRLLEANLPEGVGDVSYLLSLAACARFAIAPADMLGIVRGTQPPEEQNS